jgi:hypothetical protein
MFPFSIKFNKRLTEEHLSIETNIIMTYIEEFIRCKTGEAIFIDGSQLTFKSSLFRMRWNTNILAPIEKGKFNLISTENKSILTYEFFMYRMLLIASIMSVIIGIFSSEIWYGMDCFLLLGGMNWIIALIRHRIMLGNIVRGIETLINENKGSR